MREILASVADPEIPTLSILDLGIVRGIRWAGDRYEISITPTYAGCPALATIEAEIVGAMRRAEVPAAVRRTLAPAWTTAWLTESAREKLRESGIAPPGPAEMRLDPGPVACPHCGSSDTERISAFGSTACKSLHRCTACGSPFDYFKPI